MCILCDVLLVLENVKGRKITSDLDGDCECLAQKGTGYAGAQSHFHISLVLSFKELFQLRSSH